MKFYALLAASAVALSCAPVQAATVFSDGFEGDADALALTALSNFTVTDGNTVDIVSPATDDGYGMSVASKVVDLDGSPGPATLTSINSFAFNAGDFVRLSFDIGGAQRGSEIDDFFAAIDFGSSVDLTNVGINFGGSDQIIWASLSTNGFSASSAVYGTDPMVTRSLFFTAASAGSLKMKFGTNSNDNVGPLLDNVVLDVTPGAVPEPASWAMMIGGFGLAGAAMRRRQSATVRFA